MDIYRQSGFGILCYDASTIKSPGSPETLFSDLNNWAKYIDHGSSAAP